MNRGRHIVLEGPDASGKKTQSMMLVEWLNGGALKKGEAQRVAFPRYEEPWGKMVTQYLSGGSPSADPYYASILYAADRAAAAPGIIAELDKGNWIVCDRYVESNRAHQVARAETAKERATLAQWISDTEYGVLGIPRPDLTILLNVPYDFSHRKSLERLAEAGGGKADRHEGDDRHLKLAWEQYQQLAKEGRWPIVECSDGDALLPREVINAKIQDIIQAAFL
jgi:dTMP kinase